MIVIHLSQLFDLIRQSIFIVGTGLTVFLCLRNSLIWHMQQFWGASGDFWQRQWENMHGFFNQDDQLVFLIGSLLFTTAFFWSANVIFMILDVTGWPSFLHKYKVQADKNCPLKMSDLMRAVKVAMFNQTVVALPFYLVMSVIMRRRGCSCSPSDLPTFQWAVMELLFFTLVEEVCFYYSHRLFHHPKIYKHVHKMHHEWTAPIGIASIYAHPVEHLISNLLPPALGPLILGSHLATSWMFWAVAIFSTTVAHCGYHMPFLASPEAHDFHHLKFNQNFGVLGVLDRLHGTDIQFRNSLMFQRHFMLMSTVPVSQQVPELAKKKPE